MNIKQLLIIVVMVLLAGTYWTYTAGLEQAIIASSILFCAFFGLTYISNNCEEENSVNE